MADGSHYLRTPEGEPMKLSTSQQRLLLRLLDSGATEVSGRLVTRAHAKPVTVGSLESLDFITEDETSSTLKDWSLHFTPAGMSIARELRRMRFQEPKPFAVRT
jgi:hypothetical protein